MGEFDPTQDLNSMYGGILQPSTTMAQRPSFLDAFQAGAAQQQDPRKKLLGGLAGQAGAGGALGALGHIATFLL